MNWTPDWNLDSSSDGWLDGRSNGPQGISAVIVPRSVDVSIVRIALATLILAGVVGGLFQAFVCFRIVGQVVSLPIPPASSDRTHSRSPDTHESSSPRPSRHQHSTIR